MSGTLSPTMAEALRRCVVAHGLKYVRGGFWIEVTQDPAPFLRLGHAPQMARSEALPWSTTTHTIKALLNVASCSSRRKHVASICRLVRATSKETT